MSARRGTGGDGPIEVTLSDRPAEMDEVMRLIHDGFVERGYSAPRSSGRRLLPQYLHADTACILVRIADRPVAGLVLVCDGPFGLPADRAFAEELDAERAGGGRLIELGGFVVVPDWRARIRRLYGHMVAAILLSLDRRGAGHTLVFALDPAQARFFGHTLAGAERARDRPLYGAPADLMVSDRDRILAACAEGSSPILRLIGRLHADSGWLTERLGGEPWDPDWVATLMAETGAASRLRSQWRLIEDATAGDRPLAGVAA